MSLVATLIADPAKPELSPALADKAAEALGATGRVWLAPGETLDLGLPEGLTAASAEQALRHLLDGLPLDIAVQEAEGRRKKLLVADMDSTMIGQECIDELAAEIGIKERIAAITARAMNGEIAFEPALRERVTLLKGLESATIARVLAERITLAPGGRELIATMNADGASTALVSGGFTSFAGPVAGRLGFHEVIANVLHVGEDGRLAGTVAEPIVGREAKAEALRAGAARLGIPLSATMAAGDGANDLDMIRLAGAGVAVHAKPVVAEQAPIRIDHGDLTALLYLQGYRKLDFRS